jgi:membrane protein implicated in regulation of membrane protease activity
MNEFMILIWFGVIILAAFIEITTMDLTSVWFSIGAVFSFILAILNVALFWQIAAFIVLSTILLLSVRPLVKNYFRTNVVGTNADALVGKVATCTKTIHQNERGEVKVDGQYWSAITSESNTIEEGDKVEILAIEGNKLIVVKS